MVIVFDVGDVLLRTSMERIVTELKLPNDNFKKSKLYDDFSKGFLSSLDFYKQFIAEFGLTISYVNFCTTWNKLFVKEVEGINELLTGLAKSNQLYVLSNSNILHGIYTQGKFNHLFSKFTCVFYSFNLNSRKPEAEIFTKLIKLTDSNPADIIFIDDKAENVNAATKAGINGIIFIGVPELKVSLQKFNI